MRVGIEHEAGPPGPVAGLAVGLAAHGERFDLERGLGHEPQVDARDPVEAAAPRRFAAEVEAADGGRARQVPPDARGGEIGPRIAVELVGLHRQQADAVAAGTARQSQAADDRYRLA